MAITIKQVGKTDRGVEIKVDGIPSNRDRTIEIYIPWKDNFYPLVEARDKNYIYNFTITGSDNGYVWINFNIPDIDGTIDNYKVWAFQAFSVDPTTKYKDEASGVLNTILEFNWDNAPTKQRDSKVDITVNDMERLIYFCYFIYYWCIPGSDPNWDWYRTDYIYGEDIASALENLLNALVHFDYREFPEAIATHLIDKCITVAMKLGTDILMYDWIFNDLRYIINNINLTTY